MSDSKTSIFHKVVFGFFASFLFQSAIFYTYTRPPQQIFIPSAVETQPQRPKPSYEVGRPYIAAETQGVKVKGHPSDAYQGRLAAETP